MLPRRRSPSTFRLAARLDRSATSKLESTITVRYTLSALLVAGVLTTQVAAQTVVTGSIPWNAAIAFHYLNQIYVMTRAGQRTRLTVDATRTYEHVAVSPDRQYLAANFFATNGVGHLSRLILYDLTARTARTLVPQFAQAGNGGVDWDRQGRIYFAGINVMPFPTPTTEAQLKANAAANEIWRIRVDGSGLEQLTHTADHGEADVSVHASGTVMTWNSVLISAQGGLLELWVGGSDGSWAHKAFTALDGARTVHDPELSPDGTEIVFSMRNVDYTNFSDNPDANTAQDLYRIRVDGTGLTRISSLGLISMVPDWMGTEVVYLQASDRTTPPWAGAVIRSSAGVELQRFNGVNVPKWIPAR